MQLVFLIVIIQNKAKDLTKMKKNTYKVLLLSGSLRKCSSNTGLLRAIEDLKDPRFEFEWASIIDFPLFNEDIQALQVPKVIKQVREQARRNDAILFAVPQYNFAIASSMKNAYDWLSRQYPNDPCPVTQKIAGMVSSAGGLGGDNAQRHFNESLKFRKVKLLHETLDKPKRIQINRFSGNFFDQKGNLIDEGIKNRLKEYLNQFAKWIQTNYQLVPTTNSLEQNEKKQQTGCFGLCL